jgi:hypothetical protein
VFVLVTALTSDRNSFTTLFAMQGRSNLECIDSRIQILQGFDSTVGGNMIEESMHRNACVEIISSDPGQQEAAVSEVRVLRSSVEGNADFLDVASDAAVTVTWDSSSLLDAARFLVMTGAVPSAPIGPRLKLELNNGRFRCREGFASLHDSPDKPVLPVLQVVTEGSRFKVAAGRALLEQSGIGDPDAYLLAIDWSDSGGRYEGSPIFRRIDGAAERVEIDYTSATQGLSYSVDPADWDDELE